MAELVVLTKEEIEKNPEVVGQNLAKLANAIDESKKDIAAIKDRGFWARLCSNNTKDLADSMLKQNEIIGAYITVVQGIIWLTMNNIALLAVVMDAMEKEEHANGIIENRYSKMAKNLMEESIKSAQKIIDNENEIRQLKSEVAKLKATGNGGAACNSKAVGYIAIVCSLMAVMLAAKGFL